ncbi:MAG: type II toxin-antitoxin system VapC family toxin [Desulfurococcales archaeon]|nr:type II toxin-antitoxin system VapC family toxin [Desulfurococcales archaeon]
MVLDSSVIIKSILKPSRWLSEEVYSRELETHHKARALVKALKSSDITVLIPYPVIVEVAAVISRLAGRELAERVVESLRTTKNYIVVYEEEYRDEALKVALLTGSSGFDAYIIGLAWNRDALLITDDESMSRHAETLGVKVVLLRNTDVEDIMKQLH